MQSDGFAVVHGQVQWWRHFSSAWFSVLSDSDSLHTVGCLPHEVSPSTESECVPSHLDVEFGVFAGLHGDGFAVQSDLVVLDSQLEVTGWEVEVPLAWSVVEDNVHWAGWFCVNNNWTP